MLGLLELKEKLKNFYAENELYLKPVIKFLAVFLALTLLKLNIGYMHIINLWPIIFGISVLFAFLPWGTVIIGLGVFIELNIFTLSMELAILVLAVMLIMVLLFFRFTPKQGAFLIIIPLAFFLKIPYIIPIASGLLCTPLSIISVCCGTIIYYMIYVISHNSMAIQSISGQNVSEASVSAITKLISGNNEMVLMMVAFAVTIIIVYLIKRTSANYSWAIAILVGGILEFMIILVGSILLDLDNSIAWLIVGMVISLVIAYILQFFVFSVDYSRTEHTQFEDDEYYYYVKAVPKINVAAPEMNVKRINAQRKRKGKSKKK